MHLGGATGGGEPGRHRLPLRMTGDPNRTRALQRSQDRQAEDGGRMTYPRPRDFDIVLTYPVSIRRKSTGYSTSGMGGHHTRPLPNPTPGPSPFGRSQNGEGRNGRRYD
jgi:hypothetical protein